MNSEVPKKHLIPKDDTALQVRLGTAIRQHRQQLGITQEELAWRADMHRTYVADIERGGRNVTLRSVEHLADALKVSVADLLTEKFAIPVSRSNFSRTECVGEILLVEDNSTDAELVVRAFKRAHLTNPVRTVGDGAEALDYLNRTGQYRAYKAGCPQLILLDLNLPRISGIELLRQIKTNPRLGGIPSLFSRLRNMTRMSSNAVVWGRGIISSNPWNLKTSAGLFPR